MWGLLKLELLQADMKINQIYLEASFISFLIHASIILYLLGFFYYESQEKSVLSKPIEVSLIFEESVEMKNQVNRKLEPKKFKMIIVQMR